MKKIMKKRKNMKRRIHILLRILLVVFESREIAHKATQTWEGLVEKISFQRNKTDYILFL